MKLTRRGALGGAAGMALTATMGTNPAQAEWHWNGMLEGTEDFLNAVNA